MSDLVTKLRKAFRTFPIIEDSPVDLFNDAAKRIEALEAELSDARQVLTDAAQDAGRIEQLEATIERVEEALLWLVGDGTTVFSGKMAVDTIQKALKQHTEPPAQKATLHLGHPDGGPRDG